MRSMVILPCGASAATLVNTSADSIERQMNSRLMAATQVQSKCRVDQFVLTSGELYFLLVLIVSTRVTHGVRPARTAIVARIPARLSTRRDGRVVDGGGLENHCTR